MNAKQVHKFVTRYLEAMECDIVESSPAHITVKFSPEADKALTGRSYYWSFVERTGTPPETLTYTFVIDAEAYDRDEAARGQPAFSWSQVGRPPQAAGQTAAGPAPAVLPSQASAQGAPAAAFTPASAQPAAGGLGVPQPGAPAASDSILARYFGVAPPPPTRFRRDSVAFGSRRLDQIFASAHSKGRFVRLFEELPAAQRKNAPSAPCSTWLGVNFKVELACDMKRDEIHSFGFHLGTGEIRESFFDGLRGIRLTPKLPANLYLQPARWTFAKAVQTIEKTLEKKLARYDHTWADDARIRLNAELERIDGYYKEVLDTLEDEQKRQAEEQYASRRHEAEWQHSPRITISVINCGLFHLAGNAPPPGDESR